MPEDTPLSPEVMEVLDALSEGITLHDAEGEMIAANQAARETLRLDDSELLSRSYRDPAWKITTVDGQPLAPDELPAARAIEDGRAVRNERIVVERPDADPVVLSVNAVPIRDDAGEVQSAVISFQNITQQWETQQELESSEARFRAVADSASDALISIDADSQIVYANPAAHETFGYEEGELTGRSLLELIPEELRDAHCTALDAYLATGEKHLDWSGVELPALRSDGKRFTVEVSFGEYRIGHDRFFTGILRDVTEQKQLQNRLREQTQKYERILTEISDVVTLLNEDGTIQYESPSIQKIFGYEPDELVGHAAFELVHPQDAEKIADAFFAAVEGHAMPERTVQYRFRHANGSWRLVESTGILPEAEDLGPLVVTRDITDRVEAQQKYESIFEISPVALKLVRPGVDEYVEVNQTFGEIFGYSRSEVLGGALSEDELWDSPSRRDRIYTRLRGGETVHNEEVRLRRKDGSAVDGLFSASLLERAGEQLVIGAIQDISALKEVERELEHRSLHDSLTGLANRALLADRVEQGLARARRHGSSLGLLMLDLHQFKRINDRLGHTAGDRVLIEVARRLQGALREDDTVARWGGDEFFVVLPEFEGAETIGEIEARIHRALRSPIEVAGEQVHVEVSIGAVVYGDESQGRTVQTEDPGELIRFASLALHWAKEDAQTGFKLFDPEAEVEGAAHIRRERALREALEEGQIIPHYQPIVRLEDGEMVGAEALARWRHPERGLVSPAEFIPLAEELRLIGWLGEVVLRRGVDEVAGWQQAGWGEAPIQIGFNLSGQQCQDAELPEKLHRWVTEAGLRPHQVTLEVTETSLMQVPATIEAIREHGFAVYVDDFGTGYSSFAYLRDLELDGLKIDMTYIQGITESPSDVALVDTMLTLGQRLGLTVVAEGIETEGQWHKLQALGCELGQGYLFDHPMPGEEMAGRWEPVEESS